MEGSHHMRNPYTCIFRRTLTSRIWSLSPETRCVWLWLRLTADPEGFVTADLAGVATGANVEPAAARRAMEGFESPDPDADPDDPNEGRMVKRVKGGWLIFDAEESRELARTEARNARNAGYARARRARERAEARVANDTELSLSVPTEPPTKTKPKTTTTNKPKGEEISPLPPAAAVYPVRMAQWEAHAGTEPATLHALPDDWEPSAELRADATIAGITNLDERIASLRTGPIGGTRGVLAHQLEKYIRGFFGKWRTWEQTDRAKARTEAQRTAAVSTGKKPWEAPEPLVELDMRYLDTRITKFITAHNLGTPATLIQEWLAEANTAGKKLRHAEAQKALKVWLSDRAQKARAA